MGEEEEGKRKRDGGGGGGEEGKGLRQRGGAEGKEGIEGGTSAALVLYSMHATLCYRTAKHMFYYAFPESPTCIILRCHMTNCPGIRTKRAGLYADQVSAPSVF